MPAAVELRIKNGGRPGAPLLITKRGTCPAADPEEPSNFGMLMVRSGAPEAHRDRLGIGNSGSSRPVSADGQSVLFGALAYMDK